MPTLRPRRWSQFSLRWLLLGVLFLAISLAWLAREWRFVERRKAVWKTTSVVFMDEPVMPKVAPTVSPLPFWRRWMGDRPVALISFRPRDYDEDVARVQWLFPEGQFIPVFVDPSGPDATPDRSPLDALTQ